jgi:probable non-F420 flavinoid oxidoreductase
MVLVGYHASHEQHAPSELLACLRAAEAAGFQAGFCSDHLKPWGEAQGHSGFAWSWLGAALAATRLPIGVVTVPGWRYHPVVLAHAMATLAEMFPDRFFACLGTGEALNERAVGRGWPEKAERIATLRASFDIIRALFRGETVTRDGPVTVEAARVYSLPKRPPLLVGAALTPETAERMGGLADALVTVNQPREQLRDIVAAFRRGGGVDKPMFLQVHVAWARSDDEARAAAHAHWRFSTLPTPLLADLATPAAFDEATRHVPPEAMDKSVRISADLGRHTAWLQEDVELGFERIFLHDVGLEQRRFIDAFGAKVLPALR